MINKFGEIKKICQQRRELDQKRLNDELDQIEKLGLIEDFWELYLKKKSGNENKVNSLVAYALGITKKYPEGNFQPNKKYKSGRVGLPDIDLDFTDQRRNEVINYVTQKYGRDKVAQIITFGTMAARAVVRDVGRALGYSYSYCDKIAKMIPFGQTLEQALASVEEFRQTYLTDQKCQKLIDFAKKLEGCARHASTHACGVVISAQPLSHLVPLQHPSQDDQNIVTQYEMNSIEDLGLLKIDFLGLKNLTIIENTLSQVSKIQAKEIDIENLPLDDKKTFNLLQTGQTIGIFQLEGEGMRRYLKQLKPTQFEDIIAMIALFRPGPMALIPEYIAGKHKKKKIEYLHPKLKPILENTYALPVYQEQIMKIAQELAGFTLSEADVLRKAIGKKIRKLMVAQKEKFIEGCKKNGIKENIAKKIWHWIEPFAKYSFNKSHSASYALIAYQTAFLKAHFPVEFMASLLTSEKDDVERIGFLIEEAKRMGIKVLPPEINESEEDFTKVGENIRFGLAAIKNVGKNLVRAIVKEREKGLFTSISNFLSRVNSKDLNKKSMESLIKAGVFDAFAERNQLLFNLERLLDFSRESQKVSLQKGLFDGIGFNKEINLLKTKPATKREKILWEKELLGLFVTSHPLEDFKKAFEKKVLPLNEINLALINQKVRIAGIVSKIKKVITRVGKPMLFLNLEDLSDKIEVIVFPGVMEKNPILLEENKIVLISGRVDGREGIPKIIAEEVEEILET